jgi:hypothetical protein
MVLAPGAVVETVGKGRAAARASGASSGIQWLTPSSSTKRYGPATCSTQRSAALREIAASAVDHT